MKTLWFTYVIVQVGLKVQNQQRFCPNLFPIITNAQKTSKIGKGHEEHTSRDPI